MKNRIIPLGEKNLKAFGFNEEQIVFSSKKHKTFDSLLASTQKSGMLESVKVIPVKSLTKLNFNEKDETFTIHYKKDGKTKKYSVLLSDKSLRDSVVENIAGLRDFQKNVTSESKTKPLLLNLLAIIIIPFFTWILRGMAVDAQNGEHYVASGSKRGLKQLFASAVEAIGPIGVMIIGILALMYMIYVTYKRYNNPASEIKYS